MNRSNSIPFVCILAKNIIVMSHVSRPTWRQLRAYVQQIVKHGQAGQTKEIGMLLNHSTNFLTTLLPPRLQTYHQNNHFKQLNQNITSLPSFETLSKCFHRYSNQNEWNKARSGHIHDQTRVFGQFVHDQMVDMEHAVQTIAHESRDLLHSIKSTNQQDLINSTQSQINRLFDETYSMLIEMRIHSSHYAFGSDVYESLYSQKGEDAAEIALEYPVVSLVNVSQLARSAAESARAAAIEKFGDCVELQVNHISDNETPIDDVMMIACASHLHFMLLEVIKNAIKSTIDHYGVLNLYDAQPVKITISGESGHRSKVIGVIVQDSGIGLGNLSAEFNQTPSPATCFDYFTSTTSSADDTNNWKYSREFGNPFSGLGVGLNMTRLYSEAYGGSANLLWIPRITQCAMVFNAQGLAPIGRHLTLMR